MNKTRLVPKRPHEFQQGQVAEGRCAVCGLGPEVHPPLNREELAKAMAPQRVHPPLDDLIAAAEARFAELVEVERLVAERLREYLAAAGDNPPPLSVDQRKLLARAEAFVRSGAR